MTVLGAMTRENGAGKEQDQGVDADLHINHRVAQDPGLDALPRIRENVLDH